VWVWIGGAVDVENARGYAPGGERGCVMGEASIHARSLSIAQGGAAKAAPREKETKVNAVRDGEGGVFASLGSCHDPAHSPRLVVAATRAGGQDHVDATPLATSERGGRREAGFLSPHGDDLAAMAQYMREIGACSLLTHAQEIALGQAIVAGDLDARNALVVANLRLVVSVARRYRRRGIDLDDLIQEGNIGLARAADKYDWRKGFRFTTYAVWWIRQAMTRAVLDHGRAIHIPVYLQDSMGRRARTATSLGEQLGRTPTDSELDALLGAPLLNVDEASRAAMDPRSLDTPIGDVEGGALTLADLLADDPTRSPDALAIERVGLLELGAIMARALSERERAIINGRYGLLDGTPRKLAEVGGSLGITRERTRQIEKIAIEKLRQALAVDEGGHARGA